MKENRAAVLLAEIRALAVDLRGVVHLPESVQELLVAQLRGVEGDLDDFGVTRLAGADIFVGGIRGVAAAVSDLGIQHTWDAPKRGFDAPEAASSKRCNLAHEFSP